MDVVIGTVYTSPLLSETMMRLLVLLRLVYKFHACVKLSQAIWTPYQTAQVDVGATELLQEAGHLVFMLSYLHPA